MRKILIESGCRLDGLPICVDRWNPENQPADRFYFLTHAHDSSTFGLTKFWPFRIYCSAITARLASLLFELPEDRFEILEIGRSTMIECGHIAGLEGKRFEVVALESDHCPGSAMFLFDGWFGRILVTGGFRFESADRFDLVRLREKPIDELYVDAIDWDIRRDDLSIPTRLGSTVRTLEEIAKRSDEKILLVLPETSVGEENLLIRLVQNFEEPVAISRRRMDVLKVLEPQASNMFTEDQDNARLRIIAGTKRQVMRIFRESQRDQWTAVIFLATRSIMEAWDGVLYPENGIPNDIGKSITMVPYSNHSTTEELEIFLSQLTVRRLTPIGRAFDKTTIDLLREKFESPMDAESGSVLINATCVVNIDSQVDDGHLKLTNEIFTDMELIAFCDFIKKKFPKTED